MKHVRCNLVAGAVAIALGSGPVFAIGPSVSPGANVFYAGGAAEQANVFLATACRLLGNNLDLYSDAGSALSADYYIVYGNTIAALGSLPAGTPVLYMYKFNGGSFANGVAPQKTSAPTTLKFPTVASIFATATPVGGTVGNACTTGQPTYSYTNPVLDAGDAPDFGITGVEFSLFQGFNNPTGNAGGAAKNTSGGPAPAVGATDGLYDNIVGVAVTDNLYSSATHPKTNFTRAEVAGILAGTVSDWSQLYDDNGAQLPAGGIIFLDRGEGAAIKVSGNQYFLGYPGNGAAAHVPYTVNAPYCGTSLAACGAIEQSEDIAEASTNAIIADFKAANGAGLRAIAILGMENPPVKNQAGGTNQYDFVRINGVGVDSGTAGDNINGPTASSYINVIKGQYDFYYQSSFNTRTTLAGQNLANANAFKAQYASATLPGAASGLVFPAAVPGIVLDADVATALTKGVTINSRSKVSTATLTPIFNALPTGIPVGSDPL